MGVRASYKHFAATRLFSRQTPLAGWQPKRNYAFNNRLLPVTQLKQAVNESIEIVFPIAFELDEDSLHKQTIQSEYVYTQIAYSERGVKKLSRRLGSC